MSNFNRQFTECEVESQCSSFSDANTLEGFSFEKSPMLKAQSAKEKSNNGDNEDEIEEFVLDIQGS